MPRSFEDKLYFQGVKKIFFFEVSRKQISYLSILCVKGERVQIQRKARPKNGI